MDISSIVRTAIPVLATAIGGPVGPVAGLAANWVLDQFGVAKSGNQESDIQTAISTLNGATPDQLLNLQNSKQDFEVKLQDLQNQLTIALGNQDVSVIQTVNATAQTEAKSDHWPTYSWRPFIGFSFGFYLNSLWLLPLFGMKPIELTPDTVITVGAILGVASFFRGKAQADPRINNDMRG